MPYKTSYLDYLDGLIEAPFWVLGFLLKGFQLYRLRRRLQKRGRVITAADAEQQFNRHGGSLFLEGESIFIRAIWYTADKVADICDLEVPHRSFAEARTAREFDYWCRDHLTNEESGTALFVAGRTERFSQMLDDHAIRIAHVRPDAQMPPSPDCSSSSGESETSSPESDKPTEIPN